MNQTNLSEGWPFDQPPNCAVITLRRIVFDGAPILYVFHDEDDHGWQFLDGQPFETEDGAIVALNEMVARDPSILEVADIPPGWMAWRESPTSPWQSRRHAPDA